MSSDIEKIEKMITSLQAGLAELKKQPGDLDNPEKAIAARRELEDKITFYEEQKVLETNRLVAEQAEARKQQRIALLLGIGDKSEQARKQHTQLTKHCGDLIHQLVTALIERDLVHTQDDTGLFSPEVSELLTVEERTYLRKQWELSGNGFYPGDFSATWEKAASEIAPDDRELRHRLFSLVHPASEFNKPIAPATTLLEKAARKMAKTAVSKPVASEPAHIEPEKQGDHYVADLRVPDHAKAAVAEFVGREIV